MPELDLTGLSHDEVGANAMMRLSQKRIRSPSSSSRATPEDEDAPRVARLHRCSAEPVKVMHAARGRAVGLRQAVASGH